MPWFAGVRQEVSNVAEYHQRHAVWAAAHCHVCIIHIIYPLHSGRLGQLPRLCQPVIADP